jgi:NAD(P)-dependent dehydrogenase (short-subunit alcohol dehydrogenase family)
MALFANTALVTGTDSQGMGHAIARTLAGQGADVALHWYRCLETAEALSREITVLGRRAPVIGGDLGDAANALAAVRQATDALGGMRSLLVKWHDPAHFVSRTRIRRSSCPCNRASGDSCW